MPRRRATPEKPEGDSRLLLTHVGEAVRAARSARGMTRRAVAVRSGVSERFLAQIESGIGNVSLLRLADVAAALEVSLVSLLAGPGPSSAPGRPAAAPRIALVGLRGAGKSTIGRRLAKSLDAPFVELDARIEKAAGLTIGQIFELNGDRYFRRLEREVLEKLAAAPGPMVLATGGGIVTEPETWALLRSAFTTVWLSATPEDHWTRVVAQGDRRPMADNPDAKAELKALLDARRPLYALADATIDTSALGPDRAARHILARIRDGWPAPAGAARRRRSSS
ncbi:MAG TPA: helix-turn-helix transcriptional regulator [Candidatus Polarisedimenticolia bacterium]|nr:helix-turn-helix transcriptional regulator [Candidatus Polarisedimenticolia bacterium]